jgi:hypothetical protein
VQGFSSELRQFQSWCIGIVLVEQAFRPAFKGRKKMVSAAEVVDLSG